MAPYQIFTDATADCSPQWLASLPPVGIVPMRVEIGGQEYTYGPDGTISAQRFYDLQKEGNYASTSQITPIQYFQSFEPTLRAGNDILYLCFSSGMSGTFQSAQVVCGGTARSIPGSEHRMSGYAVCLGGRRVSGLRSCPEAG